MSQDLDQKLTKKNDKQFNGIEVNGEKIYKPINCSIDSKISSEPINNRYLDEDQILEYKERADQRNEDDYKNRQLVGLSEGGGIRYGPNFGLVSIPVLHDFESEFNFPTHLKRLTNELRESTNKNTTTSDRNSIKNNWVIYIEN